VINDCALPLAAAPLMRKNRDYSEYLGRGRTEQSRLRGRGKGHETEDERSDEEERRGLLSSGLSEAITSVAVGG